MRIAEYKRIGTEYETDTIMVDDYDEEGNVIGQHEETVTKETPRMGMVYRDMTEEEEAEMLRQQAEFEEAEKHRMPTTEERMDSLEDAFAELCKEVFS